MGEKESSKQKVLKIKENTKNKIMDKNFIFGQIFYWLFIIGIVVFFKNAVFETTEFIKNVLQVIIIIIAIVVDSILILFNRKNLKIYQKFIIIATVLGIFYFILTPFGNGTDEVSHFLRVFKISQKYTTLNYEENDLFPLAFSKLVDYKNNIEIKYTNYFNEFEAFSMNTIEKKDLIGEYWNTKLYSPIQYFPQVIGVTAGRIISDNIVVIGMCGRIAGYIFWVALCAYAIKIVPNKKIFFLIICLLPVNLFSAICISGDTVTNAVCTLFIAIIYRKLYLKEKITKKDKFILIFLSCMISLCKIVYLPFVFLVLLLKIDNFKNKKELMKFIILLIVISILVGMAWFIIGSINLANSNTASKEQLKFILINPIEYIIIILRTIVSKGDYFIYQLSTGNELMCHAKTTIYPIISYVFTVVLLISLFINDDNEMFEINNIKRILVYLIMAGTSFLIVTAIYIQWTSLFGIGNYIILGIQGRYFIPIVTLLIFVINKSKILTDSRGLINITILMQLPVLCQIMDVFI